MKISTFDDNMSIEFPIPTTQNNIANDICLDMTVLDSKNKILLVCQSDKYDDDVKL